MARPEAYAATLPMVYLYACAVGRMWEASARACRGAKGEGGGASREWCGEGGGAAREYLHSSAADLVAAEGVEPRLDLLQLQLQRSAGKQH
eukprot:3245507-Prymnesium_polylepis.1